MKKKLLSLCLAGCLAAVAMVGGTLAYFTDADKDVNVMTVGNVTIVQNETKRDNTAYEDKLDLIPAVYNGELAYDKEVINSPNGNKFDAFDTTVENEIDKVITVTNTGTRDAYVRTIILMENTADNAICEKIHGMYCDSDGQYRVWQTNDDGSEVQVTVDEVTYSVAVCTYNTALAAGATSDPSLMQIFLDPTADNEWSELVGTEFNIIAISQAVQVEGFDDAATALDTAFGKATAENVLKWVAETGIDTTADSNVAP